MDDFHFSQFAAIIIAVILVVITPTYFLINKQEVMIQNYVTYETNRFVSEVKSSGAITKKAYDDFIKKLDQTDYLYEINIEHQKKVIIPNYSDEGIFQNSYDTAYENTYEEDILEEVYNGTGIYKLSLGDYVTIDVKSRETTVSANFLNFLVGKSLPSDRIQCVDGGMIWNETF